MISVFVHPKKYRVIEEFFELFKTEWSRYDPKQPCTILLTDGSAPSDIQAELVILYSAFASPTEKISRHTHLPDPGFYLAKLPNGETLPLYHTPRKFSDVNDPLITHGDTGETIAYSDLNSDIQTIRIGYDLFDEIEHLLTFGQPIENAGIPTLDRHIHFLRQIILSSGHPVIEIPPAPPGHDFMVCLTHDVDFISIRNHKLDHTVIGFIYRASLGSLLLFLRRRLTLRKMLINWGAALSLPLIHAGICKDFWMQFEAYRKIEGKFRSTFFMIPFEGQPGLNLSESHPERRAAHYEIKDIEEDVLSMQRSGWEFGLHGIDAWHDPKLGCQEKDKIASILREPCTGTRTHWLCRNEHSEGILDTAKFDYDSSNGYNETIGFRPGTSQVFKPLHSTHLLEVPLHIQDIALFFPSCLNLDEQAAWQRCMALLDHQKKHGGVLTILWHMRSLAPERLWGDFYKRLLAECASINAWIGTARETADWFSFRRQITLTTLQTPDGQLSIFPRNTTSTTHRNITLRVYHPEPHDMRAQPSFTDRVWSGQSEIRIPFKNKTTHPPQEVPR